MGAPTKLPIRVKTTLSMKNLTLNYIEVHDKNCSRVAEEAFPDNEEDAGGVMKMLDSSSFVAPKYKRWPFLMEVLKRRMSCQGYDL